VLDFRCSSLTDPPRYKMEETHPQLLEFFILTYRYKTMLSSCCDNSETRSLFNWKPIPFKKSVLETASTLETIQNADWRK
jgi:hypothetical protein